MNNGLILITAASFAVGVEPMMTVDEGGLRQGIIGSLDRLGLVDRGPAVNDEVFEQFEHQIGAKLPQEYKEFLRVINGGWVVRPLAPKNAPQPFNTLRGLELFSLRSDTLVSVSECPMENYPKRPKLCIGDAQVEFTIQLVMIGPNAGRVELTDRREPTSHVPFMSLRQFLDALQIVPDVDAHADLSSPQNAAIVRFDTEKLKKLIKSGGDPNEKSPVGFRSLYYAALVSNVPAIKILLDAGADPNIEDELKETPIFSGCAEGIELLCKKDADVNHRDLHGRTALFGQSHYMPRALMLKKYGADFDIQDKNGRTAACEAAANRDFQSLSNIVQLGARVDIADNDGNTPLHFVSSCENVSVATVVQLLDRNPDVIVPNKKGDSCLSLMKSQSLWRNRRYAEKGPTMLERFEALAAKRQAQRDRQDKAGRHPK